MKYNFSPEQFAILRAYSAGELGTRDAIERSGLNDYADMIIALSQNDLDFPKPALTPTHDAHLARARAILQPLLRRHGVPDAKLSS